MRDRGERGRTPEPIFHEVIEEENGKEAENQQKEQEIEPEKGNLEQYIEATKVSKRRPKPPEEKDFLEDDAHHHACKKVSKCKVFSICYNLIWCMKCYLTFRWWKI